MKKNILSFIVAVVAAMLVYLFFAPVPIAPAAWTPPAAPTLTGQYEQNSRLAPVQRLSLGDGHKPEDVAIDAEGRIYAGFEDGRIMQLQAEGMQPSSGTQIRVFADTHGRPLGLVFDREGNLIVADALKGLLSINKAGEIKLLADEAEGVKFGCLNDLDVTADGTIYFTEASNKFPMAQHINDLLEHQPNGRLLAFDPKTGKARTLLKGIHFANGVAVSPDQSFVLVDETGKYRVLRVWLTGPKSGQSDVFIDNLPGFPDGISSNGRDKFWLALVTPRQPLFDRLLPHPFLRKVVYRLPKSLQPAPQRYSFVLALDAQGRVVENLQNRSSDCYAQIANVIEHNGALYFGSIGEDSVGKYTLRTANK
ncbi:MAG TPA: SMP-30/gluconolactonase/LRE family protein [Pyrinomonadaceae bacterium]|nr:SMP-30/gluconolactonase/LRE family protein [Pyrinomonadaceae bacterium]